MLLIVKHTSFYLNPHVPSSSTWCFPLHFPTKKQKNIKQKRGEFHYVSWSFRSFVNTYFITSLFLQFIFTSFAVLYHGTFFQPQQFPCKDNKQLAPTDQVERKQLHSYLRQLLMIFFSFLKSVASNNNLQHQKDIYYFPMIFIQISFEFLWPQNQSSVHQYCFKQYMGSKDLYISIYDFHFFLLVISWSNSTYLNNVCVCIYFSTLLN